MPLCRQGISVAVPALLSFGASQTGGVSSVLLSFLENCYIGLLLVVLQLIDGMSFFLLHGILIIMELPVAT